MRTNPIHWLFAFLLPLAVGLCGCGPGTVEPPERAPGIPPSAVWAGGDKGGAWMDCRLTAASGSRYRCTVWNEFTGGVWASGEYVMQVDGEPFSESPPSTFAEYNFWDGEVIGVSRGGSPSVRLVPDGWIDYPFGEGSGKRVEFALGQVLREEKYERRSDSDESGR